MFRRIFTLAFALISLQCVLAQNSEMGLWMESGITKKINKKWSIGGDIEYRLRDNLKSSDRFSVGLNTDLRLAKWLKVSAGYVFLYSNHESETSSGGKKLYDEYWYPRHRVFAGLTGTVKPGNWKLSLRERWVYTYRPEHEISGTKIKSGDAVTKIRKGKGENVLRSRFMAEYNIPDFKLSPFASIEMYNAWSVEKMKYSIGANYDFNKHNSVKLYYLFQDRRAADSSDDVIDTHVLGLGYDFSF